jgi:hypothetical protein
MKPQHYIAPQWLTMEGACRYSGLSDGTIWAYIREGYIVSANVILPGNSRGRRLINRPSLDAFIESYVAGPNRHSNKQQQDLLTLLANAADAIAEARRVAAGMCGKDGAQHPSIFD